MKTHFKARCTWIEQNNGIVKAIYEPELNAAGEYVMLNLRPALHGAAPELGKVYWIEIQPAFPHDAERSG